MPLRARPGGLVGPLGRQGRHRRPGRAARGGAALPLAGAGFSTSGVPWRMSGRADAAVFDRRYELSRPRCGAGAPGWGRGGLPEAVGSAWAATSPTSAGPASRGRPSDPAGPWVGGGDAGVGGGPGASSEVPHPVRRPRKPHLVGWVSVGGGGLWARKRRRRAAGRPRHRPSGRCRDAKRRSGRREAAGRCGRAAVGAGRAPGGSRVRPRAGPGSAQCRCPGRHPPSRHPTTAAVRARSRREEGRRGGRDRTARRDEWPPPEPFHATGIRWAASGNGFVMGVRVASGQRVERLCLPGRCRDAKGRSERREAVVRWRGRRVLSRSRVRPRAGRRSP